MHEPKIRMLDLNEYPLVATVDRQGRPEVWSTSPCPAVRARMLRDLADRVEQSGHACCTAHPADSLAASPPVEDEDPLWTDRSGRVWDLGLMWLDAGGVGWWWVGTWDSCSGAPLMMSHHADASRPLDIVDMTWGPMRPRRGGLR